MPKGGVVRPISLALGPVHNWQLNCLPGPVNIAARADRCDDSRYMQMSLPVNCLHKIKKLFPFQQRKSWWWWWQAERVHWGGIANLLTSIATFCAHDTADCRAQMSAQILSACGPRLCERVVHCSMNVTCVWHHHRLRLRRRQLLHLLFRHCPVADYASASDDRSSFCDRRSQWADPPPARPAWVMDIIALDPRLYLATCMQHLGAFGAFWCLAYRLADVPTLQLSSLFCMCVVSVVCCSCASCCSCCCC